jgi:hypothetical protein
LTVPRKFLPGLDPFLAALRRLGDVAQEGVSSADVTDEVVDLEARLTNMLAVRDRLRGYLDRAESLQDVVAVERELTRSARGASPARNTAMGNAGISS